MEQKIMMTIKETAKEIVFDRRISLDALGLLSVMLAFPGEKEFSIKDMLKLNRTDAKTVLNAFRELEKYEYVVRGKKDGTDNECVWKVKQSKITATAKEAEEKR